jgi:hypothetical protein
LLDLRTEWLKDKGESPDMPLCLRRLRCDILHHSVDLEARKLTAGTEQFRQEGLAHIPLSCFAERVLEAGKVEGRALVAAVAAAVAKCGYRRPGDEVYKNSFISIVSFLIPNLRGR